MTTECQYGNFEISGQAALHAGDTVTYVTNTGTVLLVDSQYIDLKNLMPQLKQQTHPSNQNSRSMTAGSNTNIRFISEASSPLQLGTSQTQVQLHDAYAYTSNSQSSENENSVAKARLRNHLGSNPTPQDKVIDLVNKSTQHLHLQSPSDFRPNSLLRQSIGLAGYVAVNLVTIGVEAAQDHYRSTKTQRSMTDDQEVLAPA